MNTEDEIEIKKEFQLERVILFSDAVFAIIITIMVLDIKIPELTQHITGPETSGIYLQLLLKVGGYFLSFLIIGIFWIQHLRIFSFLKDYTAPLLVFNLLFLFSVSLFPFALSFLFNSPPVLRHTWGWYNYLGVVAFTFLTQTSLMGYLVNHKEQLCIKNSDIEALLKWKIKKINFVVFPVFLVLAFLTIYFKISQFIVDGVALAYVIMIRKLQQKYYPNSNDNRLTISSLFNRRRISRNTITKV